MKVNCKRCKKEIKKPSIGNCRNSLAHIFHWGYLDITIFSRKHPICYPCLKALHGKIIKALFEDNVNIEYRNKKGEANET